MHGGVLAMKNWVISLEHIGVDNSKRIYKIQLTMSSGLGRRAQSLLPG